MDLVAAKVQWNSLVKHVEWWEDAARDGRQDAMETHASKAVMHARSYFVFKLWPGSPGPTAEEEKLLYASAVAEMADTWPLYKSEIFDNLRREYEQSAG